MAVRQVQNALALIEYFAARGAPASLAEIQGHFGWPRSSTYNILGTLVDGGYMYEAARHGGYYPTRRWLDLAQSFIGADPVDARLSKIMARLAEETGETAILAAPAGRHAVYIDVLESSSPVRYAARSGMRLPIHAAASGRALLSRYSPAERRRILAGINYVRYGEGALMSPEDVETEITASLDRGWFQSLHEYDADLAAIAVPLPAGDRRLALAVAGPISRLGDQCGKMAAMLTRHVAALQ